MLSGFVFCTALMAVTALFAAGGFVIFPIILFLGGSVPSLIILFFDIKENYDFTYEIPIADLPDTCSEELMSSSEPTTPLVLDSAVNYNPNRTPPPSNDTQRGAPLLRRR